MAFYTFRTTPVVNTLQITSPEVRQVCLADDISGAGSLGDLIIWWKNLISECKMFGYLVNEKKSWLILKGHGKLQRARHLFSNTGIKLTTDGQCHLEAAIGTSNFRAQYIAEKVRKWTSYRHCKNTTTCSLLSIYTRYQYSQYTYFMRMIPGMHEVIKPVDDVIRLELLSTLWNTIVPEVDRQLHSLPFSHAG